MTTPSKYDARELALEALLDRREMVTRRLERLLEQHEAAPADAALATELALGVMRRRRTLDEIIRAFATRANQKMPGVIRHLLRLGVYQLVFLDRTPDYAAVNEAVESAKRRRPRQAGFVNALLRRVAEALEEPVEGPPPLDRHTIALSDRFYRRVKRELYHDPDQRPDGFFGSLVSLPDELAGRWMRRFPKPAQALAAAMQVNARPPVVLRANLTRITAGGLLEELTAAGVEAFAHANGRSVVLAGGWAPGALACVREGRASPQDPTATEAGEALDVRPGMRVLDFCAAPGGKTMQIAEKLDGLGSITAVDVNEDKLQRIAENATRCGWTTIELQPAARVGSLEQGSYDRVLVDAPCSNTGVLARRVEARWRFTGEDFRRLCADQRQILRMASLFLKPGGKLLYSTCSVEPQENENVVKAFLSSQEGSGLRRLTQRSTWPQGFGDPAAYRDGGYYALLG